MPTADRTFAHTLQALAVTAASALCLVAVPPTAAGGDLAAQCPALAAGITLDGSAADWDALPFTYLDSSVHVLALSHDDTTLYIMFRFADERLAQQILRRGVVLWLDPASGHDTELGVRYGGSKGLAEALAAAPAEPGVENLPGDAPPGWEDRPAGAPHPGSHHLEPGSVAVLSGDGTQTRAEDMPGGPRAASAVNDGVYAYEVAVPLSLLGDAFADPSSLAGRTFQLGIQVGGMSKAERKAMREAFGGGHGGFSGGFGGGGHGGHGRPEGGPPEGGGRPGGGGRSPAERTAHAVTWLDVTLG